MKKTNNNAHKSVSREAEFLAANVQHATLNGEVAQIKITMDDLQEALPVQERVEDLLMDMSIFVHGMVDTIPERVDHARVALCDARVKSYSKKLNPYDKDRAEERLLRAKWEREDAEEALEAVLESFSTIWEEWGVLKCECPTDGVNVILTTKVKDIASPIIKAFKDSLIKAVSSQPGPHFWTGEVGDEVALQKGISKFFGAVCHSKLSRELEKELRHQLGALKGGPERRKLNKAYKAYCKANGIILEK